MEGFEILDKLGEGAYSTVYKVKRKEDSNIYALKKVKLKGLSDKEKQNALNEVRILASVKSPFVISYKEAFIEEESEALCIVMEYADKGDLYQKIVHLKKIGCLIEEIDAWKIFIQMVRGLKSLHDLKILHRDLKSANIFLFSDGTAKIGDLNVSKVAQKGLGYTQTGTPYYASPEVWNENPYDNKSDIWSLGCVTYEMLTLHPPFRAKDMEELYNRVIKGQYKKIGDHSIKEVYHLNYIGWQDNAIPNIKDAFDILVQMFNFINKEKSNTTVIHCSAGVGRTGSFLTMINLYNNLLLQKNQRNKYFGLSIFGLVRQLKEMRVFLVKNETEFNFIHKFIYELLEREIFKE
jgi:NIMA (never in mitosis gene a)-related kinase